MAASPPPAPSRGALTRIEPPQRRLDIGLQELWQYRELIYFFVWRDLKVRYKQTVIGAAWAVIQPFLIMVVFTVFFGNLLGLPTGELPAPVFYYSGLLPWTYFSTSLVNSANSLVEHQRVITKIYFPRLTLPCAAVLPGLVDLAVAFIVLIAMMGFYGLAPSPATLLLPLFLSLGVLTALAAGLWLSALNAIYRDVRYALPFVIQMWFFASPVIYSAEILPSWIRPLYGINPMVGVIEGFRWSLTGEGQAPGAVVLVSFVVVLIGLFGGAIYFRKKEAVLADLV